MASLAFIVAVAANGVIGRDNKLPWHIPEDLKWFKENTMGKPIIMGRKTFESLGRILPGRPHIVISRNQDYEPEGVHLARSIDEAINIGNSLAEKLEADEIMVIGGENIYRQMLPLVSRVYRTYVDMQPEGDAYFPELDADWQIASEKKKCWNGINFFFQVVEKSLLIVLVSAPAGE